MIRTRTCGGDLFMASFRAGFNWRQGFATPHLHEQKIRSPQANLSCQKTVGSQSRRRIANGSTLHIQGAGIDQRFLFDTTKKEMTGVPAGKIEGVPLQRFAGVLAVGPCTGKENTRGGNLSLLLIPSTLRASCIRVQGGSCRSPASFR